MRSFKALIIVLILAIVALQCYQKDPAKEENILKGQVEVICDETLTPIIEDQIAVFESQYDAKIKLIPKSEAETVNALMKKEYQIAVLARDLDSLEKRAFQNQNIIPKVTKFASDAIVFIRHKENNDTIVDLADVVAFIEGKSSAIRGLVLDDANSSTATKLLQIAGKAEFPKENVYAMTNNEDAIRYVAANKGMIGVIGLNWIMQPNPEIDPFLKNINVLSVKSGNDKNYYSPTQNNLAEGKYPLARDLFIVNCQGYSGLGMGFASFIAGEKGQRIVLKSGLLPVRIPSRKVLIRNQITNSNK
jgi:phosphate transport system substrate-binding protein